MLRELGPLLAEEGIDVNDMDVPDMETLQNALNRAVERRNMALFTPVGQTRELALTALRLAVDGINDDDSRRSSRTRSGSMPVPPCCFSVDGTSAASSTMSQSRYGNRTLIPAASDARSAMVSVLSGR